MAFPTQPLGVSYLSDNQLPEALRLMEAFFRLVYDDAAAASVSSPGHNPTIGIGLNLRVRKNLVLVLDSLGVFAASDAQSPPINETTAQTEARYDAIVDAFAGVINNAQLTRQQGDAPGSTQSEQQLRQSLTTLLNSHSTGSGRRRKHSSRSAACRTARRG